MNKLCDYGCGQMAKYQFKNGKRCCSKSQNSCPIMRERNSDGNRGVKHHMYGKHCSIEHRKNISKARKGQKSWNKGLTKEIDERLKKISELSKGREFSEEHKKRISESCKGRIPWNKGKKAKDDLRILNGENHGMYNNHHTKEIRKILSKKKKEWYKEHPNGTKGKNNGMYGKGYITKRNHQKGIYDNVKINPSKISQKFFWEIYKILSDKTEDKIYFAELNKEYIIGGKHVDFCIPEKRLILEFYGDYWHMNPEIYNYGNINNHLKMEASKIWEKDKKRSIFLKNQGYKTVIIWEKDYKDCGIDLTKGLLEEFNLMLERKEKGE